MARRLVHLAGMLLAAFVAAIALAPAAHAQSPSMSTLRRGDIAQATALAQTLTAHADPVSAYVWAQFPPATQLAIANAAASPMELETALLSGLNALLADNQFFTVARFAGVRLSPQTRILSVQSPSSGENLARRNRLLLEDTYASIRKGPPVRPALPTATGVRTSQDDYPPGATAPIHGWGFTPGETVVLQVVHVTGTPPFGQGHLPWSVVAGTDGAFQSSWHVDEDDSLGATFRLTAVGQSSNRTAEHFFTDALEARVFEQIRSFGAITSEDIGTSPYAGVIQGTDGALYGTTNSGGSGGYGTVFKVNTDGSGFTTLHDFDYSNGGYPYGALIQGTDGALYGTAYAGGSSGNGTVFKLNTDGTGFTTLHSFNYSNGANPYAGVTQGTDGALYGTTVSGGSGVGTVFKLNTDGTGFTTLQHFNYSNGAVPFAGLTQGTDGALYGTTTNGGSGGGGYGYGTVFKLNTDGSGFTTLQSFNYSIGGLPYAGVTQGTDGALYGTTSYGGSGGYGTVFKLNTDGSGLTTLQSFNYSNGGSPYASVTQGTDGALYGTTYYGGSGGSGTVFKLNPDGTGFTTLQNFNYANGGYPYASVTQGTDGALYGTTLSGGSSGYGTVFKLNTDGTNPAILVNFHPVVYDLSTGINPVAALTQGTDGALYGTTNSGGSSGAGTVFKVNTDGSGFTTLQNFDYTNGGNPYGALIQGTDGVLYGTTQYGGSNGYGTVFKLNPDGSGFTTLQNFDYSNGAYTYGGVTQGTDGTLYGTTYYGGSGGSGTVFKLNPDGTGFTTLQNFDYSNGGYLQSGVIQGTDGALYGTTAGGGSGGNGTVFKLNPDGTGFTTLQNFDYSNGGNPIGTLIQGTDGVLYGNTYYGGSASSGNGTVFKLNPDGSGFTTLHHFDYADGAYVIGTLTQGTDGALYGTTNYGGSDGAGTVFGLQTDGSDFTTLMNFHGSDGGYPYAGVIQGSDGALYGATQYGGATGYGTLFRLVGATPIIANAGVDFSVDETQAVVLDGTASSGPAGMTFNWTQVGGTTVLLSDATVANPTFDAPIVVIGGETLTFQLTVSANGVDASDTVNVTVVNVNHTPVADAGVDQEVAVNAPVTLTGQDSFDVDNDTLTWSWVQVSGPVVVLSDATSATPTFTAPTGPAAANHVVAILVFELMVDDGFPADVPAPGYTLGSVVDTVTVTVTEINHAPVAVADIARVQRGSDCDRDDEDEREGRHSGDHNDEVRREHDRERGRKLRSHQHHGASHTVAENTLVTLDGTDSSDADGDALTYAWTQTDGPAVTLSDSASATPTFTTPFVSGNGQTLTFLLTVTDGYMGSATDTVSIKLRNTSNPPVAANGRPTTNMLWPPDHGRVAVGIRGVSDSDHGVTITITGVTQDEPTSGLGQGDTPVDAFIRPDGRVLLRAERAGNGNGRVYHIHFTASDAEGSSSSVVTVTVPRDKRSVAVDDGQLYSSIQ